jgi:hypothetical protein
MARREKCRWPGCLNLEIELVWLKRPLCRKHWLKILEQQDRGLTNQQIQARLDAR